MEALIPIGIAAGHLAGSPEIFGWFAIHAVSLTTCMLRPNTFRSGLSILSRTQPPLRLQMESIIVRLESDRLTRQPVDAPEALKLRSRDSKETCERGAIISASWTDSDEATPRSDSEMRKSPTWNLTLAWRGLAASLIHLGSLLAGRSHTKQSWSLS